MLSIDSIERGVVIDHIKAGKSMEIYNYLNLDRLDSSVAIIKNVKSKRMGKKDIMKIDDAIDVDLDMLGFIDDNISVNIIDGGVIIEKKKLTLPERVVNIVKCKNPRCITSIEPGLDNIFRLTDKERGVYRCQYCEQKAER
ncbi:MAG: aspartate carbamoyltransferase regulatory subunit [Christensenellaceae bacterium]|jgi:aspartate carbamoyltransferase regulatory subunit